MNAQITAALTHKAINAAKTKSAPLTRRLRRKERLDHLVEQHRRNSAASIDNAQHDRLRRQHPRRRLIAACGDRQRATFRHGGGTVERQIEYRVLELSAIDINP